MSALVEFWYETDSDEACLSLHVLVEAHMGRRMSRWMCVFVEDGILT